MRRLALAITLLLILGACSDAGDTTVDPTDTSTTVASATDEAPSSTTSTSEPPPPASQAPVPSGPIEFETFPGTPPNEFETFAADMVMTMTIDDVAIEVSSVGVWTDTAFECTVSSELGGIAFSESVIATPEELWLDNGRGYEPSDLFGSSAQDILSNCPASPLFWASFNAEDFGAISGDEGVVDGRSDLAVLFDVDDLRAAVEELDRLHCESLSPAEALLFDRAIALPYRELGDGDYDRFMSRIQISRTKNRWCGVSMKDSH